MRLRVFCFVDYKASFVIRTLLFVGKCKGAAESQVISGYFQSRLRQYTETQKDNSGEHNKPDVPVDC